MTEFVVRSGPDRVARRGASRLPVGETTLGAAMPAGRDAADSPALAPSIRPRPLVGSRSSRKQESPSTALGMSTPTPTTRGGLQQ